MQQLSVKLKNAPGDTSLVPCSVNSELNRERETFLSVQDMRWLITIPKRTNLGTGGILSGSIRTEQIW